MFHFNGTAWVRLIPPSTTTVILTTTTASTTNVTANFVDGGIIYSSNYSSPPQCSVSTPISSMCKDYYDEDKIKPQASMSKSLRRAPLKQLFPRTPTPFKKAYDAAVRKGGRVDQLDLQKSPELFEDLQEIIYKDVILPSAKRSRRTAYDQPSVTHGHATSSSSSSQSFPAATPYLNSNASNINVRYHTPSKDSILDTTSTPSKVLNDSSFLLSPPPFQSDIAGPMDITTIRIAPSAPQFVGFVEPEVQPEPLSLDWIRIACGKTTAQTEMTSMARNILRPPTVRQLPFS